VHPADPSWCARINAHRSTPPPPAADTPSAAPAPLRRREIPREHECELCGTVMYDHNCKIVCPNCGYKRDCSDP
jgi:ribosomal protein L37E